MYSPYLFQLLTSSTPRLTTGYTTLFSLFSFLSTITWLGRGAPFDSGRKLWGKSTFKHYNKITYCPNEITSCNSNYLDFQLPWSGLDLVGAALDVYYKISLHTDRGAKRVHLCGGHSPPICNKIITSYEGLLQLILEPFDCTKRLWHSHFWVLEVLGGWYWCWLANLRLY